MSEDFVKKNGLIETVSQSTGIVIPESVEDKLRLLTDLRRQGSKTENLQALCIAHARIYNFKDNERQAAAWVRENCDIKDPAVICQKWRVGKMLHDISQIPEVFERLLTLSYRKNLILTVIPSVSLLCEFIVERQYGNLLETLSRDDVRKARDYFLGRKHIKPEPAPEPEERKPEQLEFNFSAAESACRAVCAFRSEDDLIEASRKLNRSSSLHLAAGSAGVFKISAHYWLKHPEAVPAPETLKQIKEQYCEGIALLDRITGE